MTFMLESKKQKKDEEIAINKEVEREQARLKEEEANKAKIR